MAKTLFAVVVGMAIMLNALPAAADWSPQDGHKMHFPQLPDEQGWDVNAVTPVVLADDWRCSETGPVTKVHFWGSWRDVTGDGVGDVGVISSFIIRFWSDVPDPDGTGSLFSHPGSMLWQGEVNAFNVVPIDPPTLEAWFDPSKDPDVVVPNDHDAYFQYNLDLTQLPQLPFIQTVGQVYWISVSAIVQPGTLPYEWGWKSTIDHFNDDAVWAMEGLFNWTEMYEPPRVNNFNARLNVDGTLAGGNGTNAFGSGWYFYPQSGWYNIWFYDNPFTFGHTKVGQVQCMVVPADPLLPAMVTVAINWSTSSWSQQQPAPTGPPLPGVDEGLYIGRQIIYQGPVLPTGVEIYQPILLQYNPEWVSIDIMGSNVVIMNGVISHECYRTSLDLAFVIQGNAPTGACCYPDGSCANLTQAACIASGGLYAGNGSACTGDLDGNGVDDACEQVTPKGACCMPDGTCLVRTPIDCSNAGGTHMGIGVLCQGDLNQNGVDDACETVVPTGACCFDNGSCLVRTQAACAAAGGTYSTDGSVCQGDLNQNGVDDACEGSVQMGACCFGDPTNPSCVTTTATLCAQLHAGTWHSGQDCATYACPASPEPLKWEQKPDLTPFGVDVKATFPMLLADDFQCVTTGPIVKVDVYASWYHDILPGGNPLNVGFTLSLHADIPDPDGTGPGYSMPGPPLCIRNFMPGEFVAVPVNMVEIPEGYYDPSLPYFETPADFTCWKYTFQIMDPCWVQSGTEQHPMVYWLDVQAQPLGQDATFGWKTSRNHWNDDAVWTQGPEPSQGPWLELRYPQPHPMSPQSIDLAFAIYTRADTCAQQYPGDFDNNGIINANDLTALTAFVAGIGSPPPVHANGDFNGDCRINSYDVTDLTNYLASGAPLPVDCTCQEPYPFRDCCIGKVGNVNLDPTEKVTISDISMLIDHLFISGVALPCHTEADVNQSGGTSPADKDITISDISILIDYLFITGPDTYVLKTCF
jgi:hypothetical protein